MRDWNKHIDSYGLLTHCGDGGDTANREGLFAIAEVLAPEAVPVRAIEWQVRRAQLEISPGIYVRHPEASRAVPSFWSNPNEFSRDQQLPLTVGMIFKKDKWAVDRIYDKHMHRFFKCQNKDWFGPAIYIRAYGWYWLYPVLCIMDLALVANSLLRIFVRDPDNVGDDLNHTVSLVYARCHIPTPVSWFARKLYSKFRDVQRAWDHYFREVPPPWENQSAPPLNEVWAPIIAKYIVA